MIARFHPLLWLGLLLVSCDKPEKNPDAPDKAAAAPRATKSTRQALDDPSKPRDRLRAAFKKAGEIAAPEERNQALAAAVWEALELDPQLAREGFLQLCAGSEEKNRLVQHFAMRLAEQNVDDAVRWASALETETEKSLAFGKIALVLSEKEPARAARLLSDSGVAGREFDVAVVQVVQRWAAESPADAAAWVVLFDPGEARGAGLKTVLSLWAMNDPQAALAWIAAIPDETVRHQATLAMAEALGEQPESVQDGLLQQATPGLRARLEKTKAKPAEE